MSSNAYDQHATTLVLRGDPYPFRNPDVRFEVSCADVQTGDGKVAASSPVTFYAHRFILEAFAPKLASLFDSQDEETITTATITNVKPTIFRHLLCYVYGGNVAEEDLNAHAKDIINAANEYDMINLKSEAEAASEAFTTTPANQAASSSASAFPSMSKTKTALKRPLAATAAARVTFSSSAFPMSKTAAKSPFATRASAPVASSSNPPYVKDSCEKSIRYDSFSSGCAFFCLSTWAKTRARPYHNTPSRSTTHTSSKTPLPTTNRREVKNQLMTAPRGESILENMFLGDAESEESLASFGNSDGKKWDAESLMGLRDTFHPLFNEFSNKRSISRRLDRIETNPDFVLEAFRIFVEAKAHSGAKRFIEEMKKQVVIVQDEQDEFSMRIGHINQMKKIASDKTAELVEQFQHGTEEEVQKLSKQIEELDRQQAETNEMFDRKKKEIDRQQAETNEMFDRKKKENDRKIEELRGACKKKEEDYLHNQNLNTVNAGKYEKDLDERNYIVKNENALRLAIPLAWKKCDEMGMELLDNAIQLQDASFGATDDDRMLFRQQKEKFFRFISLLEDEDDVLIDQAFQTLYG